MEIDSGDVADWDRQLNQANLMDTEEYDCLQSRQNPQFCYDADVDADDVMTPEYDWYNQYDQYGSMFPIYNIAHPGGLPKMYNVDTLVERMQHSFTIEA